MDCFGQKRRRKKEEEREKQKFHHLTPHTSPAPSQPSTLPRSPTHPPPPASDPHVCPRWVATACGWVPRASMPPPPSPAYAFGAGKLGGRTHHLMQPAVMTRASSDTWLPHPRTVPGARMPPPVPARRAISLQRVYSTGPNQQRIYHSQGLPSPLSPVYEFRDPHNGSVYDVYQIGGGTTSSLLAEHKPNKGVKRLQRSQSDVVTEPSRRTYRTKPSSAELRASRASSTKTSPGSTARGTPRAQNKPSEQQQQQQEQKPGQVPDEQGKEGEEKILIEAVEKLDPEQKVAVVASATDSMKLLAKNKTDDQKTVDHSSSSDSAPSATETSSVSRSGSSAPSPAPLPLHYSYQGDIYAVPDKATPRGRSDVTESATDHSRGSSDTATEDTVTIDTMSDLTHRAGALHVDDTPPFPPPPPTLLNPIYMEVDDLHITGDVVACSLTPTPTEQDTVGVGVSPSAETKSVGASLGDHAGDTQRQNITVTGGYSGGHPSLEVASPSGEVARGSEGRRGSGEAAASAPVLNTAGEVGASGHTEEQPAGEGGGMRRRPLQEQWSYESESTSDEITKAGKHISVTAEAFQFLDTYLSDEDGTDLHSPPVSPVVSDRRELL